MMGLWLLACAGAPESAPPPPAEPLEDPVGVPECAAYLDDRDTWGFCLMRQAERVEDSQRLAELCGEAGRWEEDCFRSWVSSRLGRPELSRETLLAGCRSTDCRFEVLDGRPDADPLVQMALCREHLGALGPDCAGHAGQRWQLTEPALEELEEMAAAEAAYPDKLGWWVGAAMACSGQGSCDLASPLQEPHCRQGHKYYRAHPEQCQRSEHPRPEERQPGPR